jgi:hypothetical protein
LRAGPPARTATALRVIEKSEKTCLVAASLSTPVRVEAQVIDVEQPEALLGA